MDSSNPRLQLKVLVVGCTPLARKVFALAEELTEVVGVVNLHPDLGLSKSNYDTLANFASRRQDDIHWTKDINGEETMHWISERNPDVLIQCGWSQIFSQEVLDLPRMFCIGIHPAPLPVGRGAAVINWKLIEGGGPWGNSLFIMEAKTDTGDVLDFEPFDLEPRDDIRTAHLKVDRTALVMLRRTLPKLAAGTYCRRKQDAAKATRYRKRKPEDGLMYVHWEINKILDFVRALTHPYPGAFFHTVFGQLIVWKAERGVDDDDSSPRTIVEIEPGKGILLKLGFNDTLWLTLVTPPNDVECWSDNWARSKKLNVGDVLIEVH